MHTGLCQGTQVKVVVVDFQIDCEMQMSIFCFGIPAGLALLA